MTNVRKIVVVATATGALLFGGASAAAAAEGAPAQSLPGMLTGAINTSLSLSQVPVLGGITGG